MWRLNDPRCLLGCFQIVVHYLMYISEKIREGRDKVIRLFQILSMIWIPLALILTAVGIAMIAVGAQGEMGWPIFNVGPLLIGVCVSSY